MTTISFDLHKLGWKAFQDLVGCIFTEVMGQSFQQYADVHDGGRDGAYYGQWTPQDGEALSGSFTIQCKHTSNENKTLPDTAINEEFPKIGRLSIKGLVDNYIFVTNHTLTGEIEQDAKKRFEAAGARYACVYGPKWINTKITENPRLRRLVPRVYGLGDLTQILSHQSYRQTLTELLDDKLDLECFVSTEAYRKSARALSTRGFVILLGEPGSGKSVIAKLLALSAADEWELQPIKLHKPDDLERLFNPDDPGQFLWIDDAFGATQFDLIRVQEWNQRLSLLKSAINHDRTCVVFTSRDYIFNAAKDYLKERHFELFNDNQITIKVEELTEYERQMILYNHLKCGKQSQNFCKTVKPWLVEAAATRRFLPEIARRFANPIFTEDMKLTKSNVTRFFENPVTWLEGTLSNFAPAEKAALALVFIAGGRLPIPIPEEDKNTLRTIATMDSTIGAVKASLNALNNALIRSIREDGREYWCFQHPTIRDAFASLVGSNPELIDIYLAGTSAEKLMEEVTCGDLSLEGVKIIVPPGKYSIVLDMLKKTKRNPDRFLDPVSAFLARRCRGDFIEKYFTECESMESLPNHIEGFLHSYDNTLTILSRLCVDGRLPEEIRLATKKKIYSLADKTYSLAFTKAPIVHLLTVEEKNALINQVKDIIFSNGSDLIQELADSWDQEEDPDGIFSTYEETLSLIMDESEDEDECSKAEELMDEVSLTKQVMEEELDASKPYGHPDKAISIDPMNEISLAIQDMRAKRNGKESKGEERNIFDDVDE